MEFVGGDADLGAEAVFATVGEAGGGVDEDAGGVDFGGEFFGGGEVGGDDGVGVLAGVFGDVGDGFVDRGDLFDSDDIVEEFGAPVGIGGEFRVLQQAEGELVGAHFNFFLTEGGGDAGEDFCGDVLVNQQAFFGVAEGHAVDLGGDGDLEGHVEVGHLVDVDVADAAIVFDDGDGGLFDDATDESFAAAGDDEVDEGFAVGVADAAGGECADGGAVGGLDELDGVGGDAGVCEALLEDFGDGFVGVDGFLAAAQDARVARFQADAGGIGGDVGPGLKNDGDDADGDAAFFDAEAVGAVVGFDGLSDGVGLGGDFAEALGHGGDFFFGESEAGEEGAGDAVFLGLGEILGVFGDEVMLVGEEGVGDFVEGEVFL